MRSIRGLWRFDGDDEPARVSRRGFLFMGGVVVGGALLPRGLAMAPGEAEIVATVQAAMKEACITFKETLDVGLVRGFFTMPVYRADTNEWLTVDIREHGKVLTYRKEPS